MSNPTVFLSAASIDLGVWRKHLHTAFSRAGFRVLTQDESLSSAPGDVKRLLKEAISESDCVIHLAGVGYGSHSQDPFPEAPGFQCSWTQFEYYHAHATGTDVIAFVCAPDLSKTPFEEKGSDKEKLLKQQLQEAHRARVASGSFEGTPLEGKNQRTSNESISNAPKLLEAVASAVGALHSIDKAAKSAVLKELSDIAATLCRIEDGMVKAQVSLNEIENSLEFLETQEKSKPQRMLSRVRRWTGLTLGTALFTLALIDILSGAGKFDIPQMVLVTATGLGLLVYFLFKIRFVCWLSSITGVATLCLGAIEPFFQDGPFYISFIPNQRSWNWEAQSFERAENQVSVVLIRDPIRPILARWLCPKLAIQPRMLPVMEKEGAAYFVLPIEGRLEGEYFDGVAHWRTTSITTDYPSLKISYNKNNEGFFGMMGYGTAGGNLLEVTQPLSDRFIPWDHVRLVDSLSSQIGVLLYSATLNESLEHLIRGDKEAGCRLLFSLIDPESPRDPVAPSGLERARVMLLRIAISRALFRGNIGDYHVTPFLGPVYDILHDLTRDQKLETNDMTARWAISSLYKNYEQMGITSKTQDMQTWNVMDPRSGENWDDPENTAFSMFEKQYLERMESKAAEAIANRESHSSRAQSFFKRLNANWSLRSIEELAEIAKSPDITRSEFVFLVRHTLERGHFASYSENHEEAEQAAALYAGLVTRHPEYFSSQTLRMYQLLADQSGLLKSATPEVSQIASVDGNSTTLGYQRSLSDILMNGNFMSSNYHGVLSPFGERSIELSAAGRETEIELLDSDFDFTGAWWEDSFLHSFSNILMFQGSERVDFEDSELAEIPALRKILKKVEGAATSVADLDFFSRDEGGAGHINLPWLLYWECVAKGHNMQASKDLDRICRDVTKQAFGDENAQTCMGIRSAAKYISHSDTLESVKEREAHKIIVSGSKVIDTAMVESLIRDKVHNYCMDLNLHSFEGSKEFVSSDNELRNVLTTYVEDLYRERGYFDVKTDISVIQAEGDVFSIQVTIIQEGNLRFFGEVSITGTIPISFEELLKDLPVKAGDTYSDELISKSTNALLNLFHKQGYIDTQVTPHLDNSGVNQFSLTFEVMASQQFRIDHIKVDGVLPWGEVALLEMTTLKPGMVLDLVEMSRWKDQIEEYYHCNGYPTYEVIVSKTSERSGFQSVVLSISPL